jgi:hypothetical protein
MGFCHMAVCQNLVPLVNIKIAGKWMFIPLKMVLIGIDPYPYFDCFFDGFTPSWPRPRSGRAGQRFRRLSGDQGHRGVTVWLPQGLDGFRGFFFPNKMTIPSINGMNFMGFHGISMEFHGISCGFITGSDVMGIPWDPHVVTIGFLRQDSRSIGRDDGMIWVTPHVTTINHHH